MAESILSKPCTKCGVQKSGSDFAKQAASKDGLKSACKACNALVGDVYRGSNLVKITANNAAWREANPEKARASRTAWKKANPERVSANKAESYKANAGKIATAAAASYRADPEVFKRRSADWRAANRAKVQAINAAYCAANPDKRKSNHQKRRARKIEAGGKLSQGLASKLFQLQRGKCPCCGLPLGDDYHLDHKMPLALGGTNADDNMQLLRKLCNHQKGGLHPVEFMQSRGLLV